MTGKPAKIIFVVSMLFLPCCGEKLDEVLLDDATDEDTIQLMWGTASGDMGDITVVSGQTVRWILNDTFPHTVTSSDGAFQSSDVIEGAGEYYEYIFEKIGSYPFYCSVHPSMKGVIQVTPP